MDWLDNIGQDSPNDFMPDALNVPDNDTAWHQNRLGKFTASRLGDLMTKGRAKDKYWGDTAMNYIYEKVAELMTGVPHYTPETRAMEWGNDHEAEALERFSEVTGLQVEQMGKTFIQFSDNCGGSPDGYVEDDAIAEVKCPYNSANHIKTYIGGEVPKAHYYQCQGNMLFTGRDKCYYISYDPRMPEDMQLKIIEVERDEKVCDQILARIEKATEELAKIQKLTGIEIKINLT